MLRYGAPYVVVGPFMTLLVYMGRLVLGWRASVDEIGVYSVAIRYAGLVEMALMRFKIAWWTFTLASYSASGDGLFGRTLSAYVVAVGCLIVGLYSLSEFGIFPGGRGVHWGVDLRPAAAVGGVCTRVPTTPGGGHCDSGRSFSAPMGSFVGLVVGLAVILALWPTLGVLAAA